LALGAQRRDPAADVAAEVRAALRIGVPAVKGVGISSLIGQVKTAVGVGPLDQVDAFGDLTVTPLERGTGNTTRSEYGIRLDRPRASPSCDHTLMRRSDSMAASVSFFDGRAIAGDGAVLIDDVASRPLAGESGSDKVADRVVEDCGRPGHSRG
jgi:hypothetical protein